MLEDLEDMLFYIMINIVAFYIFPFLSKTAGGFIFTLIFLIPMVTFISSLIYGIINGFNIVYPIIIGLIFIPCVFTYYSGSAWIYVFIYSILSLIGSLTGSRSDQYE